MDIGLDKSLDDKRNKFFDNF